MNLLGWLKEHPYLAGGLVVGLLVLYILWKDLSSASSAAASTTASTGGVATDPNAALELQTGAALQQSYLQAQTTVAGYNSQNADAALAANAQNTQTLAAAGVTNLQTTSALTLGLAQQGESTPSILSLLQGQINPFAAQANMYLTSGVPPTTANTTVTVNPSINQTMNPPVTTNVTPPVPTAIDSSQAGGLWPTQGTLGLNDLANSIAQSEQGWSTEVAPTQVGVTDNQGVTLPGNSCPSGYYFQNGQCLSADYSPAISGNLAQIASLQQQGFTVDDPESGWVTPAQEAALVASRQHGAAA